MTVIKKYSENKELIAEDLPVNPDSAEAFVAQYSPEYTQGYLQALTDFNTEIEKMIWKNLGANNFTSQTISTNKMIKFHHQKIDLIEKLKLLGVDLPKPNDSLNL